MSARETFLTALERLGGARLAHAKTCYQALRAEFPCLRPWEKFLTGAYASSYPLITNFKKFCRRLSEGFGRLFAKSSNLEFESEIEKSAAVLFFYDLGLSSKEICSIFRIDLATFRRISRSRGVLSRKFLKTQIKKERKGDCVRDILSEIKKFKSYTPAEIFRLIENINIKGVSDLAEPFFAATPLNVLNMETSEILEKLRQKFPTLTARRLRGVLRAGGLQSLSQYGYCNRFFDDNPILRCIISAEMRRGVK